MIDRLSNARNLATCLRACGLFAATLGFVLAGVACGGNEPEKRRIVPNNAGERGESCRTTGDCNSELACINNTCVKNEYNIDSTSNVCRRIQCTKKDDCCELSPQCKQLQDMCDNGDQVACDRFERQGCGQCDRKCEDGACVQDLSCEMDQDCGLGGNCKNGKCVQCESDSGCRDGEQCTNNECQEVCEIDENCPLFQECQDGDCVEVGCKSDRECVLFADDGDATCQDGECLLPCNTDAECNQGSDAFFQVCEEGKCKFVGCENDRECRVALGLENTDVQASCEQQSGGGG